jgi:menaquinone-9 beta-reductase
MQVTWDLVVVGGGPAGSAVALRALQLRPHARVLIVDRADFPRDKPCGDGVAPHVLDVLRGLDVGVDDVTGGYVPVDRLRLTSPTGYVAARRMRRSAYVIPRAVLDARLLAAARHRGAQFRRHRVRSLHRDDDTVVLDGSLRARAVVGADGAESTVRRLLGLRPNRPGHVAVAIRGYAPVPVAYTGEQVITMTGERWPAYAWSFPIGDGRANIGYGEVLRGHSLGRARMLQRLHELVPGAWPDANTLRAHRLPLSSSRPRVPNGPVLLAGDALSLINPMTGEGIFYAVLSGALAGEAALAGSGAGDRYRRLLGRHIHRHLAHTTLVSWLSSWPRLVDGGLLAAHRDQRVFDDFVELGLGDGRLTVRATASAVGNLLGGLLPFR